MTIRTETGVEMVVENNKLPLYVSVLIYYDYSRGQIRDVVENKTHSDAEDLNNYQEVAEKFKEDIRADNALYALAQIYELKQIDALTIDNNIYQVVELNSI